MNCSSIYFLSGIPRSGSTVLAAILNQHPSIHVSTTSGLVHALDGLANTWASVPLLDKSDPQRKKLARTMRSVISGFYDEDTKKPIVIDKARGWPIPVIVSAMAEVLGRKPKIIATVRGISDCMASFVRVVKPENLDEFMKSGELSTHLAAAYRTLEMGYKYDPSCFLIIEYDNLVANPKLELERVHEFLGLNSFEYDFDNIDGSSVKEDDEMIHKYAGMHDIKPKLERQHNQSAKEVLGRYYFEFDRAQFWKSNS